MNERLSDPAEGVLGRFISRDPIGFAGGLNLYVYPTSPVDSVDPSGLDPTGALPPGWSMTTQPDGVNAYTNQGCNLRANVTTRTRTRSGPDPIADSGGAPMPVPSQPPIFTGTVLSGTTTSRIPARYPPMAPPPGVSIEANMARADLMGDGLNNLKYKWFIKMVRGGGPWDFKQCDPTYEDFGNFHYGAVGTAFGFSESMLLRGAGGVQILSGTSSSEYGGPGGGPPYGDDPKDQRQIRRGIVYAKSKGY